MPGCLRLRWMLLMVGGWIGLGGFPAAELPAQQEKDLQPAFQRLAESVALELRGTYLTAKFPDQGSGQALLNEITRLAGAGGGSSSSGNNNWRVTSHGDRLHIDLGSGMTYPLPNQARAVGNYLHVVEKRSPYRQLYFEADRVRLQVLYVDPSAQQVFRLRQTESGKVLCQVISENRSAIFQANSIVDIWFEQDDFLNQTVFPSLQELGLGTDTIQLQEVLAQVVFRELRHSAAQQAEFLEAFADLRADDFEMRDAATKRLEEQFATWTTAIARGLRETTLDAEVRARLKKVFEAKASSEERAAAELLASRQVHRDPKFLTKLLAQASAADDQKVLMDQLRAVSGQDLGNSPAAWLAWATDLPSNSPSTAIAEFEPRRSWETNAIYFHGRTDLARLLRLTSQDGQLVLDREAWKSEFGGRAIPDLVREIATQYEQSKLPRDWLNLGQGFALESLDYPHLFFDDLSSAIARQTPYGNHYRSQNYATQALSYSLNRTFDYQAFSGELEMHPHENRPQTAPRAAQYLRLNLRDAGANGCALTFQEQKNGELMLLVVDQAADLLLWVGQTVGQPIRIHLLQGNQVARFEAATADELFQNEALRLQQVVHPVMQHLGINLSPALGGPLEITPPKKSP